MIILAFSGFLRYDELSSLKCKDIVILNDYLKIHINHSKTDQYRYGNEILISKGSTIACPLSAYKRYVELSGLDINSDHYVFKPIFRSKSVAKLLYKNKKLSYTAARQNIILRLNLVASGMNFGLHSLRSGGPTEAAKSRVNERCLKRHGRWKSDLS